LEVEGVSVFDDDGSNASAPLSAKSLASGPCLIHDGGYMSHPPADRPVARRVQLMATCLCDAFYADAAVATVQILEYLGVEVLFPENQTCCGQPAFNSGDWASSRKVVRHLMDVFGDEEVPIIVPSGSCAAMNFHGSPLQFEKEPDRERVGKLARRTWELADFIVNGLGIREWPGRYNARIAFHHSCHTRGTATGAAATALLGSVAGVTLLPFGQRDQCCGFGGTFSVTFPNISAGMGTIKLDHALAEQPDELVSADMSCLMHLSGLAEKQGRAVVVRHFAQVLRDALDAVPAASAAT